MNKMIKIMAAVLILIGTVLLALLIVWLYGKKYDSGALAEVTAEMQGTDTVLIHGRIISPDSGYGYTRHTAVLEGNKLVVTLYQTLSVPPLFPKYEGPVEITVRKKDLPDAPEVLIRCKDRDIPVPFE